MPTKDVIVVNEEGHKDFEKRVNELYRKDYVISSTSCGCAQDNHGTCTEYFMPIMVKKPSIVIRGE